MVGQSQYGGDVACGARQRTA